MNFNFQRCALLLGALGLSFSSSCAAQTSAKSGIALRFSLPSDGFATLVIEREDGVRVRNLIAETPLKKGANTLFWDGLDDWGRDVEAAKAGRYHVPGQPVAPGKYRVRGLVRPQIDLKYEFSVYAPGDPPWTTKDTSGAWLANHTAPNALLYVPQGEGRKFDGETVARAQILAGSYVAEGASGLAWLDARTGRKLRGVKNLGGNWAGAPFLARDAGPNRVAGTYAYAASVWETPAAGGEWELRVTKLTEKGEKAVLNPTFKFREDDPRRAVQLLRVAGIAAHNGLLAISLPQSGILWIDAARGEVLGKSALANPRGLVFDSKGDLLVLSGQKLLKFTVNLSNPRLANPKIVVENGLQDPQNLTLNARGEIFISDRGTSHQIKVFSSQGGFLRAIGQPRAPRVGTYNARHMNNPAGLAWTPSGELWVAENDFYPKRVSVWTNAGELQRAFYGPAFYGAGGTLDGRDKTRFYYKGMEWKLDWQSGESRLVSVFFRPENQTIPMPAVVQGRGEPETALYRNGKRYWTNGFTNHPVNGSSIAFLWREENGIAVPCAAMGNARDWDYLQKTGARFPVGHNPKNDLFFAWSDTNGDGKIAPDEVVFRVPPNNGPVRGVTVLPELSFAVSVLGAQSWRFAPQISAENRPIYNIENGQILSSGAQKAVSSGGGQTLVSGEWTISTTATAPFAPQGFSGAKNGVPLWSYPSLWPGLHASHTAPMPEFGGEVIGSTRLLGPAFTPLESDAGAMWAINGDKGNVYLFTTDGLFVATLFQDNRLPSASWTMPDARRGMLLNDVTHGQEDFWPTITQTSDGEIYLVARVPAIVRVEGLEKVRRLPDFWVQVGAGQIQAPISTPTEPRNAKTLVVPFGDDAPNVDGDLSDWRGAKWATIDERQQVRAALRVAGDQLFVAFQTNDAHLLENSGAEFNNLFTTGGGLDLMLGATQGGSRLLISQVNGRVRAMFYRPTVKGTPSAPVEFSSPQRTIRFDRVDDVTKQVKLGARNGNFEFSAPLQMLQLVPRNGKIVAGDVGILRGDGASTVQRLYWNNKATGLTSDLPSEAELTPQKWGNFKFENR